MKKIFQIKIILLLAAISVLIYSCSKSAAPVKKNNNSGATVSTYAGSGTSGAVNGTGAAASFTFPSSIVVGGSSLLYVGDFGNNKIRTINTTNAAVANFAGTGTAGFLNGTTSNAEFNGTANIAFDTHGNLYIADEENNMIREITASGNVITLAGTGTAGYKDGAAASAQFNFPEGIVVDANNNLFVADGHNNVIRKINLSSGEVSTYAGTGVAGFDNGAVASATFNDPYGLAIDPSGNIYVADILNNSIRKISVSTGMVSTYAGTGAKGLTNGAAASATFYYPLGCTFDSGGNLYVADTYNNVIREVSASGNVTTLAGSGVQGLADGPAATATFNFPIGILVNGSAIFVADTHNNVIREISFN
ncbi:MAG: SMP-30/gluconolactonase/LRE family protein [Bacteroidetes bacterium]|nr:SMP-30/gluconolactonase/LRE family protein [Bacteroidota bacterium]